MNGRKGDHDDDILESHLLPHAADGAAFEREPLPVARRIIAGGAAKAEHRIFFLRLDSAPLIRLAYSLVLKSLIRTITGAGWREAAMRERLGEPIHKIFDLIVISDGQLRDASLGIFVL